MQASEDKGATYCILMSWISCLKVFENDSEMSETILNGNFRINREKWNLIRNFTENTLFCTRVLSFIKFTHNRIDNDDSMSCTVHAALCRLYYATTKKLVRLTFLSVKIVKGEFCILIW